MSSALSRSVVRVALLGLSVAAVSLALYVTTEWSGWFAAWGATTLRALSGAVVGSVFSRYALKLDLSMVRTVSQRVEAAKSQALIIAAFVLAFAAG